MKAAPLFLKEFPSLGTDEKNPGIWFYALKKTGTKESINIYLLPSSPTVRCQWAV